MIGEWSYEVPTKTGLYLHRCGECDFEEEEVVIKCGRYGLEAELDIGNHQIDTYHSNIDRPSWKLIKGDELFD